MLTQLKSVRNQEEYRNTEPQQQKRKQNPRNQQLNSRIMNINTYNPINHAPLHG